MGWPRVRRTPQLAGAELFALVFVGYLAGSELAFRLQDASGLVAVFFVPAGITAGTLLSCSVRLWPAVLVAAGMAEFVQDLRGELGVAASAGFVAANVIEPVLGAVVVRRLAGPRLDLSFRRHTAWYLIVNVGGAPLVGALIGAITANAAGGGDFLDTLVQWWLGDALGVLLVATLIIVWRGQPDRSRVVGVRGAPLLVGLIGGTVAVVGASDLPLLFLVLTGVVVAGAQFGPRGVAVTSVAVAATIAVCMLAESGTLIAGTSLAMGVVIVKLKLLVFTAGGLVVAAEVFERERMTEAAARLQSEAAAEHAIVNRLQRLLLPPEHIGGRYHEAFGSYRAGTSALGVGGDWYDVADLPDGRVFLTVGDVVGRGAAAAAVMARLRAVMLVLAARASDAGELLGALDEQIHGMIDALGTTVWAGLYDPWQQRLSYSSAGHLPGFLLPGNGELVRLDGPVAAPLGVVPGGPKPATEVVLPGPATVVLYTDGLVERRGETIDAGIERFEQRLRAVAGSSTNPEALVTLLPPEEHDDDTVLLAVALRPA